MIIKGHPLPHYWAQQPLIPKSTCLRSMERTIPGNCCLLQILPIIKFTKKLSFNLIYTNIIATQYFITQVYGQSVYMLQKERCPPSLGMRLVNITLLTMVQIVKAIVFPVVVYRCESWIIKKAEHQRIDAFKLWCWRRILRVPWTARNQTSQS